MISLMEKESASAQYKVAIENGLILVAGSFPTGDSHNKLLDDLWIDVGWIVLESSKTGTRYSATSTGLPIDSQYVNKAREEGFEKMTAGEVMSKALGCGKTYSMQTAHLPSDAKDPHKYLCFEVLGRKEMLVQALETCLGQCLRAEGH
jgi:hypothetical protein